ncbi:MAG: hydrogenase maturation protease [Pirellulales bacterium]
MLIVGLGNTLRGDDALGPLVVDELSRHVDLARVDLVSRAALGPEIAAELQPYDVAIFVDASVDGEPGEIICRELTPAGSAPATTHILTPSLAVTLAHDLYGRAPRVFLITTRGYSFALDDTQLSPPLLALLPSLISIVVQASRLPPPASASSSIVVQASRLPPPASVSSSVVVQASRLPPRPPPL